MIARGKHYFLNGSGGAPWGKDPHLLLLCPLLYTHHSVGYMSLLKEHKSIKKMMIAFVLELLEFVQYLAEPWLWSGAPPTCSCSVASLPGTCDQTSLSH